MPLTDTGNIKKGYLKNWILVRRLLENPGKIIGADDTAVVECPRRTDVLLKPGKAMMDHPGNVLFKGLIESALERQERRTCSAGGVAATSFNKAMLSDVADEIVREISDGGGRFLLWCHRGSHWTGRNDSSAVSAKVTALVKKHAICRRAKMNRQTIDSGGTLDVTQQPLNSNRDVGGKRVKRSVRPNFCANDDSSSANCNFKLQF